VLRRCWRTSLIWLVAMSFPLSGRRAPRYPTTTGTEPFDAIFLLTVHLAQNRGRRSSNAIVIPQIDSQNKLATPQNFAKGRSDGYQSHSAVGSRANRPGSAARNRPGDLGARC